MNRSTKRGFGRTRNAEFRAATVGVDTVNPGASTSRALLRVMATSIKRIVAERPALVVVGLFYLMVTSVLAGLWSVAADANGGSIVGYSSVALVWYVAMTESGTISIQQAMIEEIGEDIGSGRVAVEMLRPASVLWMRIFGELGKMLPRLLVCVSLGSLFALAVVGPPPNSDTLPLAAIAILLATTLNVVAQHLFAGAAFWVRDAKSAWFLYQKLVFVLGGMLLPLEVLPATIETIAKFLPFMAMAYVPGRLAAGFFEPELLVVQIVWLVVLSALSTRLYARGERRLMEVGS